MGVVEGEPDVGVATSGAVGNGVGLDEGVVFKANGPSTVDLSPVDCSLFSATRDVSHPAISVAPSMYEPRSALFGGHRLS